MAVSDSEGKADLFISPGHSNHSLKQGYTDHVEGIEVATTTIDSHLKSLHNREVHLIKIDTEGPEFHILKGMQETIFLNPNLIILVELNPRSLLAGGNTPSDLIELLKSLGYMPRELGPHYQILAPNLIEQEKTCNLLCMKQGQWESLGFNVKM
jgi:hypothetical protein